MIIGLMTASHRIRTAGGIFAVMLLGAGLLWRWRSMGDRDPTAWAGPFLVICFGGGFLLFWFVAVILAWLARIAAKDMSEN